jgi:2-polyprenyl-6-methoxyphenol hydroxylase-like FAD-dependent oxidoreductase
MSFGTDVLISGAGAAGLTLAIDLARRGVKFTLIEQAEQTFGGSRGKGIQPRTQEVFEDLGVLDKVAAAGGPYPPQREYRADGTYVDSAMMEQALPLPAEPYTAPLMVAQFRTEALLRARLAEFGYAPAFGEKLIGFDQDANGVSARIAGAQGERELRARYLVGTDGGRSFIRHALGIEFPGETMGVRALVADVHLDGLDRTVWHRFQFGSAATQIMACMLAGTDLFQIQAPVPLEGDFDLSAAGLTKLLASRTGRDDIVVHDVSWASTYTMNARLAERYRDGCVFLAGDAAHVHPPTGGQGLNTSVQDAYNLGWKLAAVLDGAPGSLLDTYEEERRPIAAGMLGLATKLLDQQKEGTMRRGREVHQLDLGYHGSSLSLQPAAAARIKPGDRAPDGPCRGRGGQPTRLFTLYAGPHWTLLANEIDEVDMPSPRRGLHVHRLGLDGDILDTDQHVSAAYGLPAGSWALVRPDGYVALVDTAERVSTLESYLDRVGLKPN